MDSTALDRVLVHVRRGSRVVKRAVDPADDYFLEADGGDTLVRLRGARRLRDVRRLPAAAPLFEPFGFLQIHRSYVVNLRRLREFRLRDGGDDWEVKLDPPVNRVLPVARGELARLEAEGLVDLAELLSLLRLRAHRIRGTIPR